VVGTWSTGLSPFGTIIPDSIIIAMDIGQDESYSMTVREFQNDTLFLHNGNWRIVEDSIAFNGTDCALIDTTADPDTLQWQDRGICAIPFSLALPQSDTWEVAIGDLGSAADAFPIPENIPGFPDIRQLKLPLKKQ
jgi:hypothetical protein